MHVYLMRDFVITAECVRTVLLLVCAAQQRRKRGVLPPKVMMVKRKSNSYEPLPDHRLL